MSSKIDALFLCVLFGCSSAFSQVLPSTYTKLFAYEQNLQRKHIEQIRFDSIHDWRVWGLVNSGIRNNFIGETYQAFDVLPQVGLDRLYPLSNGELLVGIDVNGSGGKIVGGEDKASFGGYGVSGYVFYRTQSDCYLSLSLKVAQVFQSFRNRWLHNEMWMMDIGVGKRFELKEGYFIETNFHFGMGLITDTHFKWMQNDLRVKFDSQSNLPFNLFGAFSIGKHIGKHQVKTSISPKLDLYAKGKIFEETLSGLRAYKSSPHFDLLLSIAYDFEAFERTHFFTYADFHSLQFEMMVGAGVRVEFGKNAYKPLRYPKIKLDKLKKTYLK